MTIGDSGSAPTKPVVDDKISGWWPGLGLLRFAHKIAEQAADANLSILPPITLLGRFLPGTLNIIAGESGSGKSLCLMDIVSKYNPKQNQDRTAIFANSAISCKTLLRQWLLRKCRLPHNEPERKGEHARLEEQLFQSIEWIDKAGIYFQDMASFTLAGFHLWMDDVLMGPKRSIILIDDLQGLVKNDTSKEFITCLRHLATVKSVPIVVVVQGEKHRGFATSATDYHLLCDHNIHHASDVIWFFEKTKGEQCQSGQGPSIVAHTIKNRFGPIIKKTFSIGPYGDLILPAPDVPASSSLMVDDKRQQQA